MRLVKNRASGVSLNRVCLRMQDKARGSFGMRIQRGISRLCMSERGSGGSLDISGNLTRVDRGVVGNGVRSECFPDATLACQQI
jgi:hypothetical protein